jgi:diguanylate cyclase (GGDEF)-like protein
MILIFHLLKAASKAILVLSLLTSFLLSHSVIADAFSKSIQFDRFSVSEGLPSANIFKIIQDKKGFIWLATEEGVVRYDGYYFRVFKHEIGKSDDISGNYITTMKEDSRGYLWIGTVGNGLNRFDPTTEEFVHYKYDKNDLNSLSNDTVLAIEEDHLGNIWVGTNNGLNRLSKRSHEIKRFHKSSSDKTGLTHNSIFAIFNDSNNNLWIGTNGGGVNKFISKTQTFVSFQHDNQNSNSISHNHIRAIYEDKRGNIWIGTYGGGLNQLKLGKGQFIHFKHDENNIESLSSNNVWSIFQDSKNNLWVGTSNGLNKLGYKNNNVERYINNPVNEHSLSHNSVTSFLEDKQGNLWLATYGGGINRLNPLTVHFDNVKLTDNPNYQFNTNKISAILEDQGDLWLGIEDEGLVKTSGRGLQVQHYKAKKNSSLDLTSNDINSLIKDHRGNIWIGTWRGGVSRFNPKTKEFSHYLTDENKVDSLSSNNVLVVFEDSQNQLWIGTHDGGLNLFVEESDSFIRYLHNKSLPSSISSNSVRSIAEGKDGNLLIGTLVGVNIFNPRTGNFNHYKHDTNNANSLSDNAINDLAEDHLGNLWISTFNGGLNKFDRKNHTFSQFTTQQGLPVNAINSLEVDEQGNLWLGTNKGLAKLDVTTNQVNTFNSRQGLQSYQFTNSFKSKIGDLYFAGTNGLNHFQPEKIEPNEQVPMVSLTDMLLLNKSVRVAKDSKNNNKFRLKKAIHHTPSLTLTHNESLVSFEFSALHFTDSKRIKYKYRLVGLDKEWIETDYSKRFATYTNLPSGNYELRVKASSLDGLWNMTSTSLELLVLPPPWRSWWAYTIYSVLAVVGLLFLLNIQRQKIIFERKLNNELERKVVERTAKIEEKNRDLNKALNELEQLSLTDQLTGAHNRRFLQKFMPVEINTIKRDKDVSIGFIMIDADHFKLVNDTYGHDAGDMVLKQIIQVITATCRKSDWVVRLGGEEFVVVCKIKSASDLTALSEKIRRNIQIHKFDIGNDTLLNKTCSIGAVSYPFINFDDEITWEECINLADIALYAAKNSSRNAWVYLSPNNSNITYKEVSTNASALIHKGLLNVTTSIKTSQLKF